MFAAKVAEERSFAREARTMGVSVATVVARGHRLEERLEAVVNRTSRRLAGLFTDTAACSPNEPTKSYAAAKKPRIRPWTSADERTS